LSNMTVLENGWKLVDPTSTTLEHVDRKQTGEGWDWTAVTRDPDKKRISFKERKKLWAAEKENVMEERKKRGKKGRR
jgi:hypothetical protein